MEALPTRTLTMMIGTQVNEAGAFLTHSAVTAQVVDLSRGVIVAKQAAGYTVSHNESPTRKPDTRGNRRQRALRSQGSLL